jgi:hypothetical protein
MKTDPARNAPVKTSTAWTLAFTLALVLRGRAIGGESAYDHSGPRHFLQQFAPAGGWHPDNGGLFHWWNPRCFPRCGGVDDYCRKPPPRVCRPVYPPFYTLTPPEIAHP